jgi:site-specific recombinase XerD
MEQQVNNFKSWLEILNYSSSAIKSRPRLLQEFFEWQEHKNIETFTEQISSWFAYLSQRNLSLHSLKTYRNALVLYSSYLHETQQESFDVSISIKGKSVNTPEVLTLKEIESLYNATEEYPDPGIQDNGLLAMRERVILGVFYGCGVRANEGVHLQIEDILLQRSLLYIRKGKGYKERYVPITAKVKRDIEDYMTYSRPVLLRKRKHNALFTGWYGSPMKKNALYERVQVLKDIARIDKPVGLHTLRHSIATHLLQSGMKLEQIAKFLGHSSLESTQIYTHIVHEEEVNK